MPTNKFRWHRVLNLIAIVITCALALGPTKAAAEDPGTCISADEAELLSLIDAYRIENALTAVAWSQSLMTVGQWHAWDATTNSPFDSNCNLHS